MSSPAASSPSARGATGCTSPSRPRKGCWLRPNCGPRRRISRQRFFRLYETICGMTGTASGSRREFRRHFRAGRGADSLAKAEPPRETALRGSSSTPNRSIGPCVAEVVAMHRAGRPVLIGSRTIRNSELLAERLAAEGLPLELLNGRQDRAEAEIIALAGPSRRGDHRHEHGRPRHRHRPRSRRRGTGRNARHRRGVPRVRPHRPPASRPRRTPRRPGQRPLLHLGRRPASGPLSLPS